MATQPVEWQRKAKLVSLNGVKRKWVKWEKTINGRGTTAAVRRREKKPSTSRQCNHLFLRIKQAHIHSNFVLYSDCISHVFVCIVEYSSILATRTTSNRSVIISCLVDMLCVCVLLWVSPALRVTTHARFLLQRLPSLNTHTLAFCVARCPVPKAYYNNQPFSFGFSWPCSSETGTGAVKGATTHTHSLRKRISNRNKIFTIFM